MARYVMKDVEIHGTTVPAGSAMLMLMGSANRDERRFSNPDVYDVRRKDGAHISFGFGIHFCLGAALARIEGRVTLDEVLEPLPGVGGRRGRHRVDVDVHRSRVRAASGRRRVTERQWC